MRIVYFDCFSGISGDMTLGALIGVGADAEALKERLAGLNVDGYRLEIGRTEKSHLAATDVNVVLDEHQHHHRHLSHILEIIDKSELSDWVKDIASRVFRKLAEAEAVAHGTTPEEVHFHEVGAVDAIVDIVGTAICLDLLGRPKVISSPLPTFYGFAKGSHGTFPLPAPATVEILKNVPWREVGIEGELVTPTGAAIIATLAEEFGPMPAMTVQRIGYGAGKKDFDIPNVLRVMLGDITALKPGHKRVAVIETNIDDLNPQFYESAMNRLFAAGAFDVFMTPIQMKKNRPATLFSVICDPEKVAEMSKIVIAETSTLGVRVSYMDRICLDRRWETVETKFGNVRIKIGESEGVVLNASPEYDDCKSAAESHGVPIKVVHDASVAVYLSK